MNLPFLYVSISFIAGIVLGSRASLPLGAWVGLAGVALLAAILWVWLGKRVKRFNLHYRSLAISLVCVAALLTGAARYQTTLPPDDPFHLAWYNDREYDVLVTGTLTEPPDYRETYTNLKINAEKVDTGLATPLNVEGLLLARIPPGETFDYGDRVRVRGSMVTPPENEEFSYRDYLALYGIHSFMPTAIPTKLPGNEGSPLWAAIYTLKERSLENIYAIFPDPEASLEAGILLGEPNGIPEGLQQAFKDTGTAHIIAISGFNIAIIAGIFIFFFSRVLGKRWGSLAAIAGIILYTLLVGASPVVVRAAIMSAVSIVALMLGRRQVALLTLFVTAALMAAYNPLYLWDVDFQLSFAATLGLIIFAQPMEAAATRLASRLWPADTARRVVAPIAEFFLLTVAAQITTIPIMAYHFGTVSLVSFFANLFILPVQPALMVTGGLSLLISLAYVPLGKLAALFAWPFPAYTIRLVKLFDKLDFGVVVLGDLSLFWVILYYVLLFGLFFYWAKIKENYPKYSAYITPSAAILALFVGTTLIFHTINTNPDGKLHVTFINNGSADSVLIRTPGGRTILINGGESPSVLSDALGSRLPTSDRTLDWLIVASTQQDQLAALPRTLERFFPEEVLWAGKAESSFSAQALAEWLAKKQVPVTPAQTGQTLDLGDGATLKVLSVTSRGAVLLLEWKNFRALLPIGPTFDTFSELNNGEDIGNVNVLSLADSGYAPSNPPEWIEALHPQLIVLNVKAGDENGNPSPETLENSIDYPLLRTDQNGWVHISTDGAQMWVEAENAGAPRP